MCQLTCVFRLSSLLASPNLPPASRNRSSRRKLLTVTALPEQRYRGGRVGDWGGRPPQGCSTCPPSLRVLPQRRQIAITARRPPTRGRAVKNPPLHVDKGSNCPDFPYGKGGFDVGSGARTRGKTSAAVSSGESMRSTQRQRLDRVRGIMRKRSRSPDRS